MHVRRTLSSTAELRGRREQTTEFDLQHRNLRRARINMQGPVGCWFVGDDDLSGAFLVLYVHLSPPRPSSLALAKSRMKTFWLSRLSLKVAVKRALIPIFYRDNVVLQWVLERLARENICGLLNVGLQAKCTLILTKASILVTPVFHSEVYLSWVCLLKGTFPFSDLTLLVGRQEGHPAFKKTGCWFVGGNNLTGALHDL